MLPHDRYHLPRYDRPPTAINIERHIGESGMATVYVAEDLKHDLQCPTGRMSQEMVVCIVKPADQRGITGTLRAVMNLRHELEGLLVETGGAR